VSVEERANVASINWALGRWKAFVENSLLGARADFGEAPEGSSRSSWRCRSTLTRSGVF